MSSLADCKHNLEKNDMNFVEKLKEKLSEKEKKISELEKIIEALQRQMEHLQIGSDIQVSYQFLTWFDLTGKKNL